MTELAVAMDSPVSTSTSGVRRRADEGVLKVGLPSVSRFGTHAGLVLDFELRTAVFGGITTTQTAAVGVSPFASNLVPAEEVRTLRDAITAHGLTRQHVARALGVDRRSLLGWSKGEIRPSIHRVDALRLLSRVVADIEAELPGRVREVMLRRRGGSDLLDQLAAGRADRLGDWRGWLASSAAAVTVTRRPELAGEPLWAAAVRALNAGELSVPERSRVARPDPTYLQEPDEAAAYSEPEGVPARRRGYR